MMTPIRTLVVENEVSGRGAVRARLAGSRGSSQGLSLEHTATLDSAVARVREGSIDAVLLDCDVPGVTSDDAVTRLQAADPEVAIVVLANRRDAARARRALPAGAEGCSVNKRANAALLAREVRGAVERRRTRGQNDQKSPFQAAQDERVHNVVVAGAGGVVVVALSGNVLFANPSALRMLGREFDDLKAELLGFPFTEPTMHELEVSRWRILEVQVETSSWGDESVWLVSLNDVTKYKRQQTRLEQAAAQARNRSATLERMAGIDPLTEVLNRRGLQAKLSMETRRMQRSGTSMAAVMMDCDNFKQVNDLLGHAVGDRVIKQLAQGLTDALRPCDHIGRIGGDEFMVLLPDTRFAEAFQVAERLRSAVFGTALGSAAGPVQLTASLGVEMVSGDTLSIEEVIARTEAALHASKRKGKNRVCTLDDRVTDATSEREGLVLGLQRGSALRVLHEPVIRLRDEILTGWDLQVRGPAGLFEMPRDFLRVALEQNILTQVDLNCLKACVLSAEALPATARAHVHVLPSTLRETPHHLLLELLAVGAFKGGYCFELSEQQFCGEPALVRSQVRALKRAGVLVAIEGVGCGRSSLETLIQLEPELVKIDPHFVNGASQDRAKKRSLMRLIDILTAMGSQVVADGIDSRDDLALLVELGVPYGQGALWSSPS